MYTIAKRFTFSAAHHLTKVPDYHPCYRHHGHNYTVEVALEANFLTNQEWIMDYGEVSRIVKETINRLDHQDLNIVLLEEFAYSGTTTAENLAKFLYDQFKFKMPLAWIKVSEGESTWAMYEEL